MGNTATDAELAARLQSQLRGNSLALQVAPPPDMPPATAEFDRRSARDPNTDPLRLQNLALNAPHTHSALADNEAAWPDLLLWLLEHGDLTTKIRVLQRSDSPVSPELKETLGALFDDMNSPGLGGFGVGIERFLPGRSTTQRDTALEKIQALRGDSAAPRTARLRGENGFATASLVTSILSIHLVGIIVRQPMVTSLSEFPSLLLKLSMTLMAIIFGHIAMRQIDRTGQHGYNLAIAGLILGYFTFGVFLFYAIVVRH